MNSFICYWDFGWVNVVVEREWLAAQVLNIIDIKQLSPRRAMTRIPGLDHEEHHKVTSTVYALVFETLRHYNVINRVAHELMLASPHGLFLDNAPSLKHLPSLVRNLLRVMLYRLLFEKHPTSLVTNTAIILLRQNKLDTYATAMGQWLVLAEIIDLAHQFDNIQDKAEQLALQTFQPTWLTRRFIKIYGYDLARDILSYFEQSPPLYVRLNNLKNIEVALEELVEKRVVYQTDPVLPHMLRIENSPLPLPRFESFRQGHFYIQSRGSALVSYLLDPQEDEAILDACAAPGSKTTHIASLTNNKANITAMDLDNKRLEILKDIVTKYQATSVQSMLGDARNPPFQPNMQFDRILLDAPCSGTGTLATRPYAKWRIDKRRIQQYARTQKKLLHGLVPHLKEGGKLLYSTCSLLPEENENIIAEFLEGHQLFKTVSLKMKIGDSLPFNGQRLLPHSIHSEGFSLFMLEKLDSK